MKLIEKKLDKLWANIVKLRAGNKCEYSGCNKTDNLNAHHLFTRSKKSVRWNTENGICLCPYHHTLGPEAAHKDCEFLKKILGEIQEYKPIRDIKWYNKMRVKAWTPSKPDYQGIELDLNNELKKYDA